MANVAWGIDIGNRALKGVKLQRTGEGLKIVDFAFIEHDTILSEAGDNREAMVQTALAKFVGRHESRKVPICVGVSGQQSFARFVKLPPVEAKKVPEIVKFEAVQQIPFPLDEVEWSYQLFQKPEDPDIEVGIFAMRKELVNDQVRHFMEVDLDVHAVQTSPLAVYNAMRYDGRLEKGHSIVIDLGADSTDLIIADADSIWMRSLDIGGNNFTEALARAFKIDFDKAEEMKRNAKTSKYAKQIYQAMRPVFGELVGEIQRSLGFFQSGHRDVKLRKVVAMGGGFKLNGLSGYVQKNLQMPVEKPTKFNALPPEEPGAAAALSEHLLSAPAAYGMALQLVDEAKVNSSLLPTQIRQDKMWRDKTKWFGLAAGLVVGAALLGVASYIYNDMAFDRAFTQRSEVDDLISQAEDLDARWTEVSGSGRDELEQVRNVNSLVLDRLRWTQLLGRIYATLPVPGGQLGQALSGDLGGAPGVVDSPDIEAIKSVPRAQREYVKLEKLESVYTDELFYLANSPQVDVQAIEMLDRRNRTEFGSADFAAGGGADTEGGEGGGDEGGGATTIQDEAARGFVVRLTLTTPLPPDRARAVFGEGANSLLDRLVAIQPDEQSPDLPFSVAIVAMPVVRPLSESPERLREMEQAYQALQAMRSPSDDETTTAPAEGSAPDAQRPGQPPARTPGAAPGAGRNGEPAAAGAPDPSNPAYHDPLTGESRLRDTEIQILLIIQLDPPPKTAAEEGEGEESTDGEQVAGAR